MQIHSISLKNYRPFKELNEVKIGQMATIVGKNDAGKSSILSALQSFLGGSGFSLDDFHENSQRREEMFVEISFTALPQKFQIENGVDTTFKEEMLLDKEGYLRIRKVVSRNEDVPIKIILVTNNFQDVFYGVLSNLKSYDLNQKYDDLKLKSPKSGKGVTNKSKRKILRSIASSNNIAVGPLEIELKSNDSLWKIIEDLLPRFDLFASEQEVNVSDAVFLNDFRPIIRDAINDSKVAKSKANFTKVIKKSIQTEMDQICEKLKRHTDAVTCLTIQPTFAWENAVGFTVNGKDRYGIDRPLEQRGTGIRRLLMVAFFEHLVEKNRKKVNSIYAIEEPENGLHPGLQRELISSWQNLVKQGVQVIVTTHSPVFVGASPIEDLLLITREGGVAKASQFPELDLEKVGSELGVQPSDKIFGYKACVFVEGPNDIKFYGLVARKLKDAAITSYNFEDKDIGLVSFGGDNVACWMNIGTMRKLSKNFIAIKDSDLKAPGQKIPEKLTKWQEKCKAAGGELIITRKREIENYLHERVVRVAAHTFVPFNEFSNMKKLFGEKIINQLENMTAEEILECDAYVDGNNRGHELKEIIEKILALS